MAPRRMLAGAKIAVVVPAFNEEGLIARTLSKVPAWVDSVVVVDDGSRDATFEVACSFLSPRVTVLRHVENRGVGAAIVTGYKHALSQGAVVLAVMAGDDQMDPEDLAAVVGPVAEGQADYVKGNRFVHRRRSDMPRLRRWGGALLSSLTRAATGYAVSDTQCGFTALSAAMARGLGLNRLYPRFGYPNDLLILLSVRHAVIVEVPVRPVYAEERSGVRPWHVLTIAFVIGRRVIAEGLFRQAIFAHRTDTCTCPGDS